MNQRIRGRTEHITPWQRQAAAPLTRSSSSDTTPGSANMANNDCKLYLALYQHASPSVGARANVMWGHAMTSDTWYGSPYQAGGTFLYKVCPMLSGQAVLVARKCQDVSLV